MHRPSSDEERGRAGNTGDDRPTIIRLERRDRHGAVVDERGLQANGPARRSLAVNAQTGSSLPAASSDALGDDQVDRDRELSPIDGGPGDPDARLDVAALLWEQFEARIGHDGFQLGIVLELAWVYCEIAICGERRNRNRDIPSAGPQIDRLRPATITA